MGMCSRETRRIVGMYYYGHKPEMDKEWKASSRTMQRLRKDHRRAGVGFRR